MNLLNLYLLACGLLIPAGMISAKKAISDSDIQNASILNIKNDSSRFSVGKGDFLLDGKPFHIKAAELHYPRIPKDYWEHRIEMSKALGMNTICLYTFWNAHEPEPGKWDFEGQNDLRTFIELCQKHDMKVILRPGPYVCAEWEMGGLPWWLLNYEDIRLREDDPRFMSHVENFQKRVAEEVGDLMIDNGGPIIMVQVENEYGSYGTDPGYVAKIRDILRKYFGEKTTMFQCDWASNFENNGLPDLIWTMNFGTGTDIDSQFNRLKTLRPDSPLMCSEYWSGWFDKWGADHETRNADEMIAGLSEMTDKNISFSLYMTHGGTNWGHWAGANSPGYSPDVTSYDYDAPINEQGRPTEKFHLLREAMQKRSATPLSPIPDPIPVMKIGEFSVDSVAPLFGNLPVAIKDSVIRSMEAYGQGFGSILYRTILPANDAGELTVTEPHDYAQIFINGNRIGVLDRRLNETKIELPAVERGDTLDILVEATGRINFGRAIKDFKGITEKVSFTPFSGNAPVELSDWKVYLLPDSRDFYCNTRFVSVADAVRGADHRYPRGIYKGSFNLESNDDTYLDMSGFGKGLVYVNGHGIGRFWEIGPQQTLYLPGAWLRKGHNDILVFDVLGPESLTLRGLDAPVLDKVKSPTAGAQEISKTILSDKKKIGNADLEVKNGWQSCRFVPSSTKEVFIEFGTPLDEQPVAVAEMYLLDKTGKRISREPWRIIGISSEKISGNHTGDKLYDLQESTYWSATDPEISSLIQLDLGSDQEISGIELLPRAESGAPGGPSSVTIYIP